MVGERPSGFGNHHRFEPPEPSPRQRWEPSRAVVMAAAALVVVVLAVTAWWYLSSQAPAIPVASSGSSTPLASGSPSVVAPPAFTSSAPSQIVVDVAGKVRHPGVYRLPTGARVNDAVRAAGGAVRGVSTVSLNLAAPLHDGDEVVVGLGGGAPAGGVGGAGSSGGSTGLVDLNTATVEQLDALPGVGPVLAQHIVDWRTAHGGFASVDQLQNVSGIGDSKFADLKPLVAA